MAKDLQVKGGVVIMPDGSRTPSVNQQIEWFQGMREALPNADLTPAGVEKAVNKAINGKSLGKNEAATVIAMLDHIDEQQGTTRDAPQQVDDVFSPLDMTPIAETEDDHLRAAIDRLKPHLNEDDFTDFVEMIDKDPDYTTQEKIKFVNNYAESHEQKATNQNAPAPADANRAQQTTTEESTNELPNAPTDETTRRDNAGVQSFDLPVSNASNTANETSAISDAVNQDERTQTSTNNDVGGDTRGNDYGNSKPNSDFSVDEPVGASPVMVADADAITDENATTNQDVKTEPSSTNQAVDYGNDEKSPVSSATEEQRAFEPTHKMPDGTEVRLETDEDGVKYFAEKDTTQTWDYTNAAEPITNEQTSTPSDLENGSEQDTILDGSTLPNRQLRNETHEAKTVDGGSLPNRQLRKNRQLRNSISNDGQTTNSTLPNRQLQSATDLDSVAATDSNQTPETLSENQQSTQQDVAPTPLRTTNAAGKPFSSEKVAQNFIASSVNKDYSLETHEAKTVDGVVGIYQKPTQTNENVQAAKTDNLMPTQNTENGIAPAPFASLGKLLNKNDGNYYTENSKEYVVSHTGTPFSSEDVAVKAIQTKKQNPDDYDIVPVTGGFAIAQKTPDTLGLVGDNLSPAETSLSQNVTNSSNSSEIPNSSSIEQSSTTGDKNSPVEPQTQQTLVDEKVQAVKNENLMPTQKLVEKEEGAGAVINDLYSKWSSIKDETQQKEWATQVKDTKFGTYGTQPFLDVLNNLNPKFKNEVERASFITEIQKAQSASDTAPQKFNSYEDAANDFISTKDKTKKQPLGNVMGLNGGSEHKLVAKELRSIFEGNAPSDEFKNAPVVKDFIAHLKGKGHLDTELNGRLDSLQDDVAKVEMNKDPDTGEVYYLVSHPIRRSGVDVDRKTLETQSPRFAGYRKRFDTPEKAKEWGLQNGYQFENSVTQGDVSYTPEQSANVDEQKERVDLFNNEIKYALDDYEAHPSPQAISDAIHALDGLERAKNAQSNSSNNPNSSTKLPIKTAGRIELLTDLANIAVSRKGINKAFSEIKVSPEVAQKVKEKTGIDVTGWVHGIDEDSVRHIFKQHGNEATEKARGQIAVTAQDIASIREIVENPDEVSKGKDINGIETVIFKKTIGDMTIYVQEIRVGKQKLAAKTLWKIPVAPTATADNAGELHTSETFNAHNSQSSDNVPKTTDIYNRSNRSNEPDDEQKSALVAKAGVTGTVIQSEKQRLDLSTFSENADVKALGFDAQKLKEAEHLIEQIAETALNRKQSELNEQALAQDLEKLAQDPKNGITVEQLANGATMYTMTVDGKDMSFTRQSNKEDLDSEAREQVDELRNKLVEIGAGEWDVASLTMHVQPLDETAVNDMRARAKNTAKNATTAEAKMKAAGQARKAYLFFDSVMNKLKNVFYGLFQSIASNPQKAKEIDDAKLYKWRSSDNTVMFTVQKGRANFKVFEGNKDIKGNSPAERKGNIALKAQLLDEIASVQASATKRGKIQAATSERNKPIEVNSEVARMLMGHPVLQSLFEPVEAGTFAKNFEGFTAARGYDYTPPSKQSEPAPNNPQSPETESRLKREGVNPVEKAPESPEKEQGETYPAGTIVDLTPNRTVPSAVVIKTEFDKVMDNIIEMITVKKPDGKELKLAAFNVSRVIEPVEKSPENKQVDDNVSKNEGKIDTSVDTEESSTTGKENLPVDSKMETTEKESIEQPKLSSDEIAKYLADSARGNGIGYSQNKDGTFNLNVNGTHIATVKDLPQYADDAAGQVLKNYKAALDSEGKTLPTNPQDMTRDQFLIANKFGNLIQDFETDGSDIKTNDDGTLGIDHDVLYDRIQAQKNDNTPKIESKSEQVKTVIENATPETKALKENGNLIVGTVGFNEQKPTKGDTDANTTRASVSDGDVSTATNEPRVPAKEPRLPNSGGTRKSRAGLQAGQRELIEANHVASWADELPTDERVVGYETDAENKRPVGREDGIDGSVSKPVGAHNFSLIDKPAISLTPAKRRDVNALAEKILEKPISEVTEADKEILRQYTGVGGLNTKDQVDKGAGIFNQHYTHYDTIKSIYGALEQAGVKMDYILEPSVGSGNFIGMHPNAEWVAVDIDKTNTEIVKRLYQDATVHHQSYEDFNGKDFDLIISNVPFASFADLPREKHTTVLPAFKAIHNFFFAHSMDKLKDGGVMAFMTSTGTMDGTKEAAKLRASLIKKADVIGAYRLPMGTQKENASTDVMIDIIFLQKRPEGVESNQPEKNQSFVETTSKDGHKINKYFVDYPESVLGDLSVDSIQTAMGSREGLVVKGEPKYENIKVDYQDYKTSKKSDVSVLQFNNYHVAKEYADKNGLEFVDDKQTPFFKDGVVYDMPFKYHRSDDGGIFGRKLTGVFADKMAALQAIDANPTAEAVDAYKEKYELSPHNDKKLQSWAKNNLAEKQLKSYQALFDKDFNLSERFTNQVRFENSGKIEVTKDSPLLDRAESLEDADGYVIIDKADGLISDSEIQTLLDNGKYARVGANSIQNARLYYAGNIYHKIAALDKVNPIEQREKQAKLLEKVKPAPIPLSRISITGREEWLPPEARAAIGISTNADGSLSISSDTISDDFMREIMNNYLNHEKLVESKRDETPEEHASRIKEAQNLLANEILPIIKQKITDDGLEKQVVESYNRAMNFFAAPVFDGSSLKNLPQTFKGKPFKLMQHQQEGAERAIYNKKGVLAFSPGLGKTPTAIIVAHQLLQKGVVKKPLFIVPANTIHQWESSTKSLYPDAKVFEYPKYKSGKNAGQAKEWQALTAEDKGRMVNDLANNQYDYTYISTNLAQKFTVPEAKMSEYVDRLAEQISTMEKPDDELNKKQIKAKQRRLAKLVALRHSMMSAFAEDASSGFDMARLGFDAIFADEVQYYKNIGMQSEDAKGGIGASVTLNAKFPVTVDSNGKEIPDKEASPLSVTIGSERSYDFRFKTMYISEKNNGNNIFLLTGTPTPNKPLELLTLLHHMDVNILNEYGIENVGDFVDSFFDLSEVEKEGIDGTAKMETQLTGMKNVDAMKKIITRYVDYRSPESATDLTRPKQIDVNHAILMSDEAQIVFADIQGRVMQAMDDAKAKMQGEIVLDAEAIIAMYTAGRDASIDVRLYKPTVKSTLTTVGQTFEEETRADYSKIAKTVQLVAEQLKNKSDSGQLIFLDRLSFPDGGSTHEDIRNKVIAATGLSEKEVVFVNGSQHVNPATGKVVKSNPDLKRLQEIMDAYNANEIKVLIGNTSKLGVGVDLNVHTTDIYQVDKLYRPDEIEQRNNRGVRQGNKNAEVRVHTFNQIGTFDALSDRIIANKQGFNDVFWKDQDSDTVDVKAEEVPSGYDAAIELEKDPYKKRKLEIERDLEHSRSKERGLEKQVSNLAGRIRTTEKNINDYVIANNGIDNRPAPEYKDKSAAEREQAIAEFKDRMAEQRAKNAAKIATLQASLTNLNSEKEARQAELVAHRASEAQMRSKYVVEGVVSIDAIKRNDDINPSKTQSNANAYTKESLSSELKRVADETFGKGWFNRLLATGKFKMVEFHQIKNLTQDKNVQAFYHKGTTYFVADGIASKTDLVGLLKHEIGIHALNMGKDGAKFKSILSHFESMRGTNSAVDAAFKAAERAGTSIENMAEEALGYFVEQNPKHKLTDRLLAWFKQMLRQIGESLPLLANSRWITSIDKMSAMELHEMARDALRKAPDELILDAVEPMGMFFAKVPQESIALGKSRNDPVRVNGSPNIWILPKEVEAKTKGVFPSKPIRLLMGKHFAPHRGYGLEHIAISHAKEIRDSGMTAEQWIVSLVQSTTKIYDDAGGRLLLHSPSSPKGSVFIELRDKGGFYSIVTSYDLKPRGDIVWSGRSHLISTKGSNVSGIKDDTFAATRELPITPPVLTEALANTSSAQARDTLTVQTTEENIPQTPDDSMKFSKTQPESQFADDYELNRQNVKSKKQHLKDMSARFGKEAAHGIGNFLGSARTRLENISPKLGAKYIQLEHDIAANEAKAVKAVKPFMDKTKTMSKSDVIDFDFAAKNNDSAKIDELVSKYNMQAEYQAMLDALEKVNDNAKEVGMAVKDGIPKVLRDTNGFLDAIGEGVFTKRLKEYAADMGLSYDELTLEQKADIVNNMIKTGSRSIKKDIDGVTPELNQYFMGTNAAILSHIHEMTKHAQYRKFLGGISKKVRTTQKELEAIQADIAKQENLMTNAKTDDAKESARQKRDELKGVEGQLNAILLKYALQNDYHENVASYIMKAIADGEIKPSDERIVQEVLNARLHEKGATGVTAAYKNLSLIDTMGSPISAITQIGDFTWALYESGNLFRGLKSISNALRRKAVFDKTDYGLERIAQEFTESDTFAGAVDKVFKYVGIKYVTGVASDSLLNAISDKLTRQAQTNDSRLMDKLKTYFDDDANQVLEDLKNGVINDNTRLMIYSRYLDFAPVAMSELPIKYQTAGNGRVMYMLKTYTLKLFDIYRREAVKEIFSGDKQRAIQGMKNLTMMLALLMLTGAGGDELKDYLLGRNTDFDDRVTDNLWKLAGLSKFITWQVKREGLGTAALKQILPPFAFVNAVGNDVMHADDIKRHPKNELWVNGLETTNSIPVVGKLVYWQIGRGTQKRKELSEIRFTKEKQKLNDIKDELEQLEGDEKKRFYVEHKADLWRLKQAGRIQASANRLKEIINKQRAMPKSDEREAIIDNLESKRNTIIGNFVGMS
jgi:hypothetical protein